MRFIRLWVFLCLVPKTVYGAGLMDFSREEDSSKVPLASDDCPYFAGEWYGECTIDGGKPMQRRFTVDVIGPNCQGIKVDSFSPIVGGIYYFGGIKKRDVLGGKQPSMHETLILADRDRHEPHKIRSEIKSIYRHLDPASAYQEFFSDRRVMVMDFDLEKRGLIIEGTYHSEVFWGVSPVIRDEKFYCVF